MRSQREMLKNEIDEISREFMPGIGAAVAIVTAIFTVITAINILGQLLGLWHNG